MTEIKILIRKPYDPSTPVRTSFTKTTMAKQSFKAECDINTIMQKYQKTGLIDHTQNVQGAYGDFSNVSDYHDSINRVFAAQEAFMDLPSKIRRRFDNEPGEFLAFVEDPSNYEEAVELGLLPSIPTTVDPTTDQPPAPPTKKVAAKAAPSNTVLPPTEDD